VCLFVKRLASLYSESTELITSTSSFCCVIRPPSACDVEQDWDGGESAGTRGTGTTISSPPTDIGKTYHCPNRDTEQVNETRFQTMILTSVIIGVYLTLVCFQVVVG
jgi:hypothetical protein